MKKGIIRVLAISIVVSGAMKSSFASETFEKNAFDYAIDANDLKKAQFQAALITIQNYQDQKSAEEVARFLPLLVTENIFNPHGKYPLLIGFMVQLCHEHPNKIPEWNRLIEQEKPTALQRESWHNILLLSKTPEGEGLVNAQNSREPLTVAKVLQDRMNSVFPEGLILDVEQLTPTWLDYYWGIYLASGDRQYLLPFINVLTSHYGENTDAVDELPRLSQNRALMIIRQSMNNDPKFKESFHLLLDELESETKCIIEEILKEQ